MSTTAMIQGIYPLLNEGSLALADFAAYARHLADAGIMVMQLRIKEADDRDRVAVQDQVLAALSGWGGVLVIDDRADLAKLALDARLATSPTRIGLHLGQLDLPPKAARAIVGPDVLIGLSTHSPADIARAIQEPVDYLGFGPVFTTVTKANPDPVVGLEGLAEAARLSPMPIVAIGGIEFSSLGAIRDAGAAAAATVSLLWPATTAGQPDAAFNARLRLAMEAFA